MFVIASEKFTFPLAFFMQMNISFINSNLHEFERTCLAHESKTFILDIDDMEKAKTGPSRDNKMTMLDWWKAYDNYYAFEASRYKSLEHSPRALFSKAHFNFIVNQEDSDELYHIWRPYGAKLRRQYYELETEFDEVRYANTWSEINSISASKPLPYASKEPPQHSSLSKNQQSSSNHPLSSSSYLPFCASNKGPAPRCVGCVPTSARRFPLIPQKPSLLHTNHLIHSRAQSSQIPSVSMTFRRNYTSFASWYCFSSRNRNFNHTITHMTPQHSPSNYLSTISPTVTLSCTQSLARIPPWENASNHQYGEPE